MTEQMRREMRMWICLMYYCRGELTDERWKAFAAFCQAHPDEFMDEPPPGRRIDRLDPWPIHFGLKDQSKGG